MTNVNEAPAKSAQHGRSWWWKATLLGVLVGLLVLFAYGLKRDPSFMPSALVGRTLPTFELASLDGDGTIRTADIVGKPHVINFWASWCSACRAEHKVLVELGQILGRDDKIRIIGINYQDRQADAERFLNEFGAFPYPSALDPNARTGVDFGVFGLPETFFVDANGTVRARHIGPLTIPDAEKYIRLLENTQ